jgi:hypothetical protein
METIKNGKLTITKGEKLVTVTKAQLLRDDADDLWTFVDSLLVKDYELLTINTQSNLLLVTLKKT